MSNKSPLVSAIVPTHGRSEKCLRAVESIETQTYNPIEVIVVETPTQTGSNLASRINNSTSCSITYIETNSDVGVSEARNLGIDQAKGTYLAFLDDDDEWLPKKIETQVGRLESAPEQVRASVTGNVKISPSGDPFSTHMPPNPDDILSYQLCWNIGALSTLMIHEEVCRVVGQFEEALDRREDQDFLLRVARVFSFDTINDTLTRKHGGRDDHLSQDYTAEREANDIFREKHADLAENMNKKAEMEHAFEFSLGRTSLSNGEYAKARRHFAKSLSYKFFDKMTLLYMCISIGGPIAYRLGKWINQKSGRLVG